MQRLAVLVVGWLWLVTGLAAEPARLVDGAELVRDVGAVADQRLALMPAVAAAKWAAGLPVTDMQREAAVLAATSARAEAMGLERSGVEALLRDQMRLAREAQERLIAHWRAAGYDGPQPAPDLAGELRPRIDELTQRLLRALYLAAPYLPDAADEAGAGLAAVRWSDTDRQALRALLRAVHYSGAATAARARAAGVLRVGTPGDYAPFASLQSGELRGADVELAGGLADALGLQAVFVRTTWARLSDDLSADRFDIVVGGVSATPRRLSSAQASLTLSTSGKTAIGRCADARRYRSLAAIDRPATRVIENPGGTNEAFARAHLKRAQLIIHPDNVTVFAELLARRADVMFTDESETRLIERRTPALCRLLREAYEPAAKVFLLAPGGGWPTAVDPWLAAQVARGTPRRLLDAYSVP